MKRKPKLRKQSYVRVDEKIDGHSHGNISSVLEMDESQHKEQSVVTTVKRKSVRKMKWTDNKVHENYDGSGHGRISSDTDHDECPHEQLSRFVSSSPIDNSDKLEIALAIDTSLEDPEIQFGNMYDNSESALMSTLSWHFPDQEFIMNDQQLPVASTDEPARDESIKEVQKIKIRRVNIIQDMKIRKIRNGRLLAEYGVKVMWTMVLYLSDFHKHLSLPVFRELMQWMKAY
ncbi:uncharacterized protein LOC120542160 [Polypterus senegalus]|uniref:uncharacterized protein LOC120542160 n=1 Tax=Polypterus senegalus TaxID=55291 RepID=UPI0019655151|nr:uncharacterized protein LOC120542160 [Polypterus senegalus]